MQQKFYFVKEVLNQRERWKLVRFVQNNTELFELQLLSKVTKSKRFR